MNHEPFIPYEIYQKRVSSDYILDVNEYFVFQK